MKLIFSSFGENCFPDMIQGLERYEEPTQVVYKEKETLKPILEIKKIEYSENVKYQAKIEHLVPFLARSSFLQKDKGEYVAKFCRIIYDSLRNNSDDMVKLFIDSFIREVDANPLVCAWLNDAILPCLISRIEYPFPDEKSTSHSTADPMRWATLLQKDVLVDVPEMIGGKFVLTSQIQPALYEALEKAKSNELICELAGKMSVEHRKMFADKIERAMESLIGDMAEADGVVVIAGADGGEAPAEVNMLGQGQEHIPGEDIL